MKTSTLLSAAFAVVIAMTALAPASATPVVPSKPVAQSAQDGLKIEAGHRHWRRHHGHFVHPRRHWRPRHGLSFGIVIGPSYRHRPYYDPYYEPRYVVRPRYHHRHVVRIRDPHARWCYNRYRSYDRYSNTFQPYHGRRRTCVSPYY